MQWFTPQCLQQLGQAKAKTKKLRTALLYRQKGPQLPESSSADYQDAPQQKTGIENGARIRIQTFSNGMQTSPQHLNCCIKKPLESVRWHSELRCHLQCQNAISTCSVLVVPLPSQFLTKPGPREAAAENGPSAQIAVPMRETWMKCLFPPLLLRYSTFKLNKIKIFDKSTLVIYLYDLFT